MMPKCRQGPELDWAEIQPDSVGTMMGHCELFLILKSTFCSARLSKLMYTAGLFLTIRLFDYPQWQASMMLLPPSASTTL